MEKKQYISNTGKLTASGKTPPYKPSDNDIGNEEDAKRWNNAGSRWVGGTRKGLTSKIGYLKRLGITAIWVSPIFKQILFQETYHGYGNQNFIDVDPHSQHQGRPEKACVHCS